MRRKKHQEVRILGLTAILLCVLITIIFILCANTVFSPTNSGTAETPISTDSTSHTTQATTSTSQTSTTTKPLVTPTKKVAITFDDGPHNIHSIAAAKELEKYGFHATFFAVGNRIDGVEYNGRSTISYLIEHGHEIGIHGYTHRAHYDTCTDKRYAEELNNTLNAIHSVAPDYKVKLMRPIGGAITNTRVSECDYSVILWNVDSEDWANKYENGDTKNEKKVKVDTIVNNVMSSVSDGSIILMHDIYGSTYDALKIILERLHAEGYEVVTVSELLGDPQPGTKYSHR
jgi:peptidoglycan/xylan/chitin deacetylase (PgdA/CDA1 family)